MIAAKICWKTFQDDGRLVFIYGCNVHVHFVKLSQIKLRSNNPECRKNSFCHSLSPHILYLQRCVCVHHRTTRGSSNNSMNKMRLPALPKLPRCCCSDPLNSTAISAIQFNQSGWGWRRGITAAKYAPQFSQK